MVTVLQESRKKEEEEEGERKLGKELGSVQQVHSQMRVCIAILVTL